MQLHSSPKLQWASGDMRPKAEEAVRRVEADMSVVTINGLGAVAARKVRAIAITRLI